MSEYSHGKRMGELWAQHRASEEEWTALKSKFDSLGIYAKKELWISFEGDDHNASEDLVYYIRPHTRDNPVLTKAFWEELLGEGTEFQTNPKFLQGFVIGAVETKPGNS